MHGLKESVQDEVVQVLNVVLPRLRPLLSFEKGKVVLCRTKVSWWCTNVQHQTDGQAGQQYTLYLCSIRTYVHTAKGWCCRTTNLHQGVDPLSSLGDHTIPSLFLCFTVLYNAHPLLPVHRYNDKHTANILQCGQGLRPCASLHAPLLVL